MDKLDHRELTLIKRAAEDAIHACNRHYKPFIDVVAHPLNIIALIEMAQSRQAEVDSLNHQIKRLNGKLKARSFNLEYFKTSQNAFRDLCRERYIKINSLQMLVEEKDKRIEAALVIVTKMAKATNSTAM